MMGNEGNPYDWIFIHALSVAQGNKVTTVGKLLHQNAENARVLCEKRRAVGGNIRRAW